MKKKMIILIALVLIILTIITIILFTKNRKDYSKDYLDEENFYKLTKFKIDDEEKVQIICYPDPHMMDASCITYYNFEFDKKIVVSLSRWTYYMPGSQGETLDKYEYQLTDEDIVVIKEKLEKIKNISDEGKIDNFFEKSYCIRTKDGEKTFSGNKQVNHIIDEIMNIVYKIPELIIDNIESK